MFFFKFIPIWLRVVFRHLHGKKTTPGWLYRITWSDPILRHLRHLQILYYDGRGMESMEWNQCLNPVCIEILPCWMDRKIMTYLCFLYIAVHPIHAYHCEPWQVPFRNNALWWWLIWVSLKIAYPQRKSMVYQQFSYEYSHVDPFSEVYPIFRPPIVGCKLALQCYVKKLSHAFRHGEYCCADDAMQRDLAMVRSWAPEKSAALALCSII